MTSHSDNSLDLFADKLFARLEGLNDSQPTANQPTLPIVQLGSEFASDRCLAPDTNAESIEGDCYSQRIETDRGPVWLTRHAVMCACPDCGSPVSVRTLLMLAECWNCSIAIEMTELQRRAIEALMRDASTPIAASVPAPTRDPLFRRNEARRTPDELPAIRNSFQPERAVRLLRRSMNSLPAWLISFLVNLIILLILAMIFISPEDFSPTITLSTFLSREDLEGGKPELRTEDDPLQFDSMLPSMMEIGEAEWREEVRQAEVDAAELYEVTADVDIDTLKKNLTQREGPETQFLLRDPRLRNEILHQQGGTTLTEAAVARGLRWLAKVQNTDGSWSLSEYRKYKDPRNQGDAAATSLALLPFLGAGQTHESGRYKETVMRGIKWLIERQKANGDLRCDFPGESGMYIHGQATIVIVEALAMTGDEKLREACERAIQFIENAQHKDGGWRYKPLQSGDTSVFGWQVMALQSARNSGAGIHVDRSTLKLAGYFLDQAGREYTSAKYRQYLDGALYRYTPNLNEPTPAMTAEALLCRFYLGWNRDDPRVVQGVRWLMKHLPGNEIESGNSDLLDLYYWYYGTQALHHFGGHEWETWNRRTRDLLYVLQETKGEHAGSWDSKKFKWGRAGGRIYTTSFAICSLEVYYRHLPLFDRIKFEGDQ